MTSPSDELLRDHCSAVIEKILTGSLIPVFGAGVTSIDLNGGSPASYEERLSKNIAERVEYPWIDPQNLLRVTWYGAEHRPEILYTHLHDEFIADEANDVHEFFARLPQELDAMRNPHGRQLIITTNYDRALEKAFEEARAQYDLVTYMANSKDKRERGKFRHRSFDGKSQIMDERSTFRLLPIEENVLERTIILKILGTVDRVKWEEDSFAVSDEDFIDYLARPVEPAYNIPLELSLKMRESDFLFLGVGIADWNERVVLRSLIRPRRKFAAGSWAIMPETEDWDFEYWKQYGVELIEWPLNRYIEALTAELRLVQSGLRRTI